MPRVLIVGGGISGLSTAYYLAKGGTSSTILESRPRLGGVIQTERVEGCTLEAGPDSFLSVKPAALDLIRDLGLARRGHRLQRSPARHLRPQRRPPGPPARWPDDDGAHQDHAAARPPACSAGAPSSAWAWNCCARPSRSRRRIGGRFHRASITAQEAVDYLAEPLLSGIYGGDPARTQRHQRAAALRRTGHQIRQPHARRAGRARQAAQIAGPPAPLFRTLKGGLGQLVDAVDGVHPRQGRCATARAETVERTAPGFRVRIGRRLAGRRPGGAGLRSPQRRRLAQAPWTRAWPNCWARWATVRR